jgi:putative transposase
MTFSGFLKFFCIFLLLNCIGFSLKAKISPPSNQTCTTTADCPNNSPFICCSGKCMVVPYCCPGETWCPPNCCPHGQKCAMETMKCVPDSACPTGQVKCQSKVGEGGKCCPKDLCSARGQCCEGPNNVCGDGCCFHGQCTTDGVCCPKAKGEACGNTCCPSDKPFCLEGVCSPLCNKERPCGYSFVCTEGRCCPPGSYQKLCGGKCCSEDSICVEGKCQACSQGNKPCNCPPDKKNCTPSCIGEWEICKNGVLVCPSGNVKCGKTCMNPLDRICVNGKIKECPIKNIVNTIVKNTCKPCPSNEISVRSQNICTACPSNNIIVKNECTVCPSGEVSVNGTTNEAYSYGYCCNTLAVDGQPCCKNSGIFYNNQCYARECYNICAATLNNYNKCLKKCSVWEHDSFNCTTKCYADYMSETLAIQRWMKPKCECMPNTTKKLPIYGGADSVAFEESCRRKAFKENGRPDKVTVDKSGSNKAALDSFNKDVAEEEKIEIRQIKYLNNICEQDHRFIKKRTRPMLGFKNFHSAKATISGIENIRMIQKGKIIAQKASQFAFSNFAALMA